MNESLVLVDSDAFVGWIVETDAHHQSVVAIFQKLEQTRTHLVTTNMVIAETATLLSRRIGQAEATTFLDFAQHIQTIFITEQLHQLTLRLFSEQPRKNTSFVDMANVVVAREMNVSKIFMSIAGISTCCWQLRKASPICLIYMASLLIDILHITLHP